MRERLAGVETRLTGVEDRMGSVGAEPTGAEPQSTAQSQASGGTLP